MPSDYQNYMYCLFALGFKCSAVYYIAGMPTSLNGSLGFNKMAIELSRCKCLSLLKFNNLSLFMGRHLLKIHILR